VSTDIVSVYAVFADAGEAERIGRQMVEERLAACVNILGGCRSIYRWQGAIEEAVEVAALFKTARDSAGALVARIGALHSYEVPAVAVWTVDETIPAYAGWVRAQVTTG
jgi:periplasmic divalent cation tolerance protein